MLVHLGGHLSWYDAEKRDWLKIDQPVPISLHDLAVSLGLPPPEVAIISVNRRTARWDGPPATDADVVEFFPLMGGG